MTSSRNSFAVRLGFSDDSFPSEEYAPAITHWLRSQCHSQEMSRSSSPELIRDFGSSGLQSMTTQRSPAPVSPALGRHQCSDRHRASRKPGIPTAPLPMPKQSAWRITSENLDHENGAIRSKRR